MRSYTLNVTFNDALTPRVRAVAAQLQDRTQLHRSMGAECQQTIRAKVLQTIPFFHQTAETLGGRPTGFVADAADSVTADGALEASGAMGQINLHHPWFARVFGPVHLTPKNGSKFLTIPARGEFYGRRAREFSNLKFSIRLVNGKRLPVLELDLTQGGRVKLTGEKVENPIAYWLARSVDQKQDRDRLPPDETLTKALRIGGARYLRGLERQMREKGPVA